MSMAALNTLMMNLRRNNMSKGMTEKEAIALGIVAAIACVPLKCIADHQEQEFIQNTKIIHPTAEEKPFNE